MHFRFLIHVCPHLQDLTRSFRWTTAESFRQHDVQELMRVLFAALQVTLQKETSSSVLLDTLYQGVMLDYIGCRVCPFRRERKDKFLDISLDVSTSGSLRDALRKYVEPELLCGGNQYRCDKCGKKVDADKGMKFQTLPKVHFLSCTLVTGRIGREGCTLHVRTYNRVARDEASHLSIFTLRF